jgi:hypothetical protein
MATLNFVNGKARGIAATFCIAYVLIQVFQRFVFMSIPQPKNIAEELILGSMPIHIWRSTLLLLSFFALIYVYAVIVFHEFRKSVLLFTIAFIGLLIFCFLEIGIRSVELFYIQLQLPQEYISAENELVKNSILDKYVAFQSVQSALYFPLLFSQAISSVIVAWLFSSKPKLNYLIKIAFAVNAIRLAGRLGGMFLHVKWLNSFSSTLYLPLVILIFGLLIIWFIKGKQDIPAVPLNVRL